VGFTLIEILIVLAILGILAGIVISQFTGVTEDAERQAFITSGRTFAEAAERFNLDYGVYPEDSASGALPTGFGDYITYNQWEGGTPIGGVWDSDQDFGIGSAIGVHFDGTGITRDDTYMQEIDAAVDNGDLDTGYFRKLADERYYFVLLD
jgi:prepilin-type N-terminal cleavage/methylation domain-containing protein